jgi:choline dehydrogenase
MDEFDSVVVGAGAAGCVLAARLAEDPAVRVLLLEAGPPDRKLEARLPAAFPKLYRSPLDWGFDTAPEPVLGGRRIVFPRGRTLGGSTSLNAMIYTPPQPGDLDAWADEGGAEWGVDALAAASARAERVLSVEPLRSPNPLSRAFVRALPDAELAVSRSAAGAGGAALTRTCARPGGGGTSPCAPART